MSATRPPPPPAGRSRVDAPTVNAADGVGRSIGDLTAAVRRLEARQLDRSAQVATLNVGANRLIHLLGRTPVGATVSPTVADTTFAWAMTSADERTAIITVTGVAQPGAGVEFF